MKRFLTVLFVLLGFGAGFYVGGWLLLIKPIVDCCTAFDKQILTATMVCWAVIKCILAAPAGAVVFFVIAAPLPCIWNGTFTKKRGIRR